MSTIVKTEPKYDDPFLTITENSIRFKNYGIAGGDRLVAIDEIEKVIIKKPTLWSGKWRWHGSGDFKTWFPADYTRQKRDVIFVAYIRNKWWRIGFTVENSQKVIGILQEKGLIDKAIDASSVTVSETDENTTIELRNRNNRRKTVFWIITILSGVVLPLVLILIFVVLN